MAMATTQTPTRTAEVREGRAAGYAAGYRDGAFAPQGNPYLPAHTDGERSQAARWAAGYELGFDAGYGDCPDPADPMPLY